MNTLHKNAFLAICLLTLTAQTFGAPSHALVKRLIKNRDQRTLEGLINNAPDLTVEDFNYFIGIAQAEQRGCDLAQEIRNFESNAKTQKWSGSIVTAAGLLALTYYLYPSKDNTSDDDTDEKNEKSGWWGLVGAGGVGFGGVSYQSGRQNASQKTAIDGKKGEFIAIENYLREVRNRPHAGPAAANHDSDDDDDNNALGLHEDEETERLEEEILFLQCDIADLN